MFRGRRSLEMGARRLREWVRAMEVVVVEEGREAICALGRVCVGVGIGPFAQGGLDEALGPELVEGGTSEHHRIAFAKRTHPGGAG